MTWLWYFIGVMFILACGLWVYLVLDYLSQRKDQS